MSPSKETIEKFKKIYQEEFGENISDAQAYEKFLRLTNLLRAVLKIDSDCVIKDKSEPQSFDGIFIRDKLKR